MEFMTVGAPSRTTARRTRSFVVKSDDRHQDEFLEALLVDDHDYGEVFVESIARSYSRIKQVMPDVLIVYSAIDDLAACQLLSMLKLDADMASVRVVTCANTQVNDESDDVAPDTFDYVPEFPNALQMN